MSLLKYLEESVEMNKLMTHVKQQTRVPDAVEREKRGACEPAAVSKNVETAPQKPVEEVIAEHKNSAADSSHEISELSDLLHLDHENILRGIVLSEVLGKPRCRRRGRF